MAENLGKVITIQAGADLSAAQFTFIKADGTQAGDAAADAIGILQNKPAASGRAAEIAVGGVSKCVASAAISVGDKIGCAASGKASTAATGDTIMGVALTAASADGEIFECLLGVGTALLV